MIECPECGGNINEEEDELDEGETLLCEECGKNFIVSSTDPLELELDESESGFDEDEDEEEEDEFNEVDEEEEEEEEDEDEDDDWR